MPANTYLFLPIKTTTKCINNARVLPSLSFQDKESMDGCRTVCQTEAVYPLCGIQLTQS